MRQGHSAYISYLSVEELEQLNKDLSRMLTTLFRERMADPSKRPADSVPVELLLFSYPLAHPTDGDVETGESDEGTPG